MTNGFKKTVETYKQAKTLAAEYYTSPEIFEIERQNIFEKTWYCVGHSSRIPNPGDYYLQEVFGDSLIILRDKEGEVRAHYNVCAHRGTQICPVLPYGLDSKNLERSTLQCRYHGWTYDLKGALIGAGQMKMVPAFEKEENGLTSLPVKIWVGFIFIALSPNPVAFEDLYKPILNKLGDWKIEGLQPFGSADVKVVEANWKLIMLNFNECDHCATIHPTLIKHIDSKSAMNDLSKGPILGGLMKITNGDSLTESGKICGVPLGGHLTLRTVRMGYYYSMLGNFLLNIHPDYVMFHCLTPLSATRTRIETVWLFNPSSFGWKGFRPMEAINVWRKTNHEDWEICEEAQKGISSRGYKPGWYSPSESLLIAFDEEYLKLMRNRMENGYL